LGSWVGDVAAAGGEVGVLLALCDPGENLEEILDNQEFLRVVPGDGDLDPTVNGDIFSAEVVLENPGRFGIGLGKVGVCSLDSMPRSFCAEIDVVSIEGCFVWRVREF